MVLKIYSILLFNICAYFRADIFISCTDMYVVYRNKCLVKMQGNSQAGASPYSEACVSHLLRSYTIYTKNIYI